MSATPSGCQPPSAEYSAPRLSACISSSRPKRAGLHDKRARDPGHMIFVAEVGSSHIHTSSNLDACPALRGLVALCAAPEK